ncbi:MAG: hypothetical protein R2769_08155 [Saprospiraceae bacterium]
MGFTFADLKIKSKCRDHFLKNKGILDDYLKAYSNKLTDEEVSILSGFKKIITSDFIIFKCLTNNAIFIDPNNDRFYAVKALGDRFDHFFNRFPVLVTTSILPFNKQIVYDGFMMHQGIYFGSGMKAMMNENYKKAKKNHEILTSF